MSHEYVYPARASNHASYATSYIGSLRGGAQEHNKKFARFLHCVSRPGAVGIHEVQVRQTYRYHVVGHFAIKWGPTGPLSPSTTQSLRTRERGNQKRKGYVFYLAKVSKDLGIFLLIKAKIKTVAQIIDLDNVRPGCSYCSCQSTVRFCTQRLMYCRCWFIIPATRTVTFYLLTFVVWA